MFIAKYGIHRGKVRHTWMYISRNCYKMNFHATITRSRTVPASWQCLLLPFPTPVPAVAPKQPQSDFYGNYILLSFIVLPTEKDVSLNTNYILVELYINGVIWYVRSFLIWFLFAQHLFVNFTTVYGHSLFIFITMQYFIIYLHDHVNSSWQLFSFGSLKMAFNQFLVFIISVEKTAAS